MECATNPFQKICSIHYTDHSRFIALTHFLGIQLHFPPALFKHNDDIPMHTVTNAWQANQVHAWMSEGYQTLSKAKAKGWPVPDWQHDSLHFQILVAVPLSASVPIVTYVPQNPFFMIDGSWHPDGRCGGCIAIVCGDTFQYTLYPVVILLSLDHSYAVELYVAWFYFVSVSICNFRIMDFGLLRDTCIQTPCLTSKHYSPT